MNNLEPLLKAYIELVKMWGEANVGENKSKVWAASSFLEKLIRQELKK